jgi:AraC-like DNA-binding protein
MGELMRRSNVQRRLRFLELGAISVWSADFRPLHLRRPPTTVPHHHLALLLEGEAVITQGGRRTALRAGDFYCDDRAQPHEIRTGPGRAVGIEIPEALLPLPQGDADRMAGRRLTSRDGVGALLARFLTQLTEDPGAYQPSDGPRLGTVLGDMVAALFASAPEPDRAPPPRTAVLRIAAFIQRHLSDPELTPRTVAAAHGISLSYLHRLFEGESETVAAFIRGRRLERARFDLADPAQDAVPVHAIAARWGFVRATDFARAFRAAYGIAPTDYRRRARAAGGRIAT